MVPRCLLLELLIASQFSRVSGPLHPPRRSRLEHFYERFSSEVSTGKRIISNFALLCDSSLPAEFQVIIMLLRPVCNTIDEEGPVRNSSKIRREPVAHVVGARGTGFSADAIICTSRMHFISHDRGHDADQQTRTTFSFTRSRYPCSFPPFSQSLFLALRADRENVSKVT